MWFDNYWLGVSVNGGALVNGGVTPQPLATTGVNWTRAFAFKSTFTNFTAGKNTIDFVLAGIGRTDGFFGNGYLAVVSEPAAAPLSCRDDLASGRS
ncbi:hypothetical protein [Gemmatimonas sp.]|uniref:hypothetical protein n=1 Tax=Gemmatimonas sp. TaxID=1962908 RepID=UPI003DA6129F